ncbi:hypothetical protein MMC26_007275 [Xylographa opegraphella]|nr:hypothetical protein [Xylographa opegraphella]
MTKDKVSSMTKWTDFEKLQVLFSIIDHSGPTKWTEVYIPPGRSVKAVKCMLDVTRKQVGLAEGDGTNTTLVTATRQNKSGPKAKPKAAAKGVTKATLGTKRKRSACEPEDLKEGKNLLEDQNSGSLKRVKREMEDETTVDKEDREDSEDDFVEDN